MNHRVGIVWAGTLALLLSGGWLSSRGTAQEGPASSGAAQEAASSSATAQESAPSRATLIEEHPPLGSITSLEDPSGRALDAFFASLRQVEAMEPFAQTHILQLGDSHTAGDLFSGQVRRGLQRRFGDGGRGFLFPGKPFKYYVQQNVRHGGQGPWEVQNGLHSDAVAPLGLGGIRISSADPEATLYVETCHHCELNRQVSAFEVLFWRHDTGGWFDVFLDGVAHRVVNTRSGPLAAGGPGATGYFRIEVPEGPHRLEVNPDGAGVVDFFGIILEKEGPGVSLDALGLNGAWVATPLRWDWTFAAQQLIHRDPQLIITWYGTNESALTDFPMERYPGLYREYLDRLRGIAPEASCLVMGPPDRAVRARKRCPKRRERGAGDPSSQPAGCAWETMPVLDTIIAMQREVAKVAGCAFWDTREIMGGRGAMKVWAELDPALGQPDRTHLTRAGYALLGDAFLQDLFIEFELYSARMDRLQASDPTGRKEREIVPSGSRAAPTDRAGSRAAPTAQRTLIPHRQQVPGREDPNAESPRAP